MESQPTFIELFAGIGGFRIGLEESGWKCVYANELDKEACKIYKKNFGERELYEGDIRQVDAKDIPDHTMLVGGFPCQPFSMAGKRQGFKDLRGTLFFEIARIIEAKKPSILFLENVRGLLSAQEGYCFLRILSVLDGLGYDVEWQGINSKDFGVLQSRPRVFIIGHLRGKGKAQIFPLKTNGKHIKMDEEIQHVPCLTASYSADSYGAGRPYLFYGDEMCSLTPKEFERLQGFPDDWTKGAREDLRFKMLGNAVTTKVIKYIGEKIREVCVE